MSEVVIGHIHRDQSSWRGLATENHLGDVLAADPATVSNLIISGGRQIGKTSLINHMLLNYKKEDIEKYFEWSRLFDVRQPKPVLKRSRDER